MVRDWLTVLAVPCGSVILTCPGSRGRTSREDLAAIGQVARRGVAAGERYGPAGMAFVNL
jgi:hypothetical protein